MKFIVAKGFYTRIFSLGLLVILLACGSTRTGTVKNFEELSNLVNSREFVIESEWINPLGGSRIYVSPGSNYLRFRSEEVEIFLPYFGVRHSGGGYGRNGGINYEGPPRELRITEDIDRKIELYFRGKDEGEDLRFYVTLYPNGKANISVNSSQRNSISYQGDIIALPDEDKE